ncbi:acetylxylan esterase [Wenyingzhuangia sp. chi5]|uniref:Acetylxylan esterase n=1 Tax=Wenyingzhuangia gilva TaxID=3057677 RepID=A0ABT8VTL2_9FLAO|nr:acetylxylan esterase [Wenyingzhuangia sp. chi5]MDO3695304.1 acetylxylan esterase [Wenyingzhuangia sp. chi5]
MKKNKYILACFLLWTTFFKVQAQTSDNNYKQPLTETINRIAAIFKVEIKDGDGLLKDKELEYAQWKIDAGNIEVSFANVLSPFNLSAVEQTTGVYKIKKFQYHKISEIKGAERLQFLANSYQNKEDWEKRKSALKSCMISAFGIDKAPKTPDSKPVLTKKRKYKGYSVENIGLEILPGVYATGSIYKPYPLRKKAAVILTPNGHFGGERYRDSEQIRCTMLAKMGAIVVSYDLFAWGESKLQFPSTLHRNSIASTIQVLNGMRLLDYVATLKYADMSRVGVTGGSGGGSQTLFLTALDDRIKVSVPVVMVSSYHSGGCPCESGRGIHLCGNGTNNVEIAAMAAPRPQLIVSDGGDWTHNTPEVEFPFVQRTYEFYGKKDLVKNAHFPKEGHNYKESKRMAMYPFMAKYLDLDIHKIEDKNGKIDESTCELEPVENLLVFGKNGEDLPKNALKDIDSLYELFGEVNLKDYK